MKIKDWYKDNCPDDDDIIDEIASDYTFEELFVDIFIHKVFDYEKFANDSIVRVRVFNGLADICGLDYDTIYKAWLNID